MDSIKAFFSDNSQKLTLLSSALLALFSLGVLITVNRPITGINEGVISDRVLGESDISYPYLLDFSDSQINVYSSSEVMVAGNLMRTASGYVVKGENKSELVLDNYSNSGSPDLKEGEETKAIVTGILTGKELDVQEVFFVPAVISSQRLLGIIAKEIEPYRDCLDCQKDDVLQCLGGFKIDSKAAINPNGTSIILDYALITSKDEYYRVSLNILNNQNLVFQDASNLQEQCK